MKVKRGVITERRLWIQVELAVFLLAMPWALLAQEAECSWKGVERIVAVGDIHGDSDRFVELLRAAGVVNEKLAWSGGKTHLVQAGDVLDRGPDSRKAMDLLRKLEPEAEKAGGRVHALIGNHEALVMFGRLMYAHEGEEAAFGGAERLLAAMGPKGEYGKWICGHNAVIRINDVLFLHGGISPAFADRSLASMNDAVRDELAGGRIVEDGVTMHALGPLWYRGYATKQEEDVRKELGPILKAYDAKHVVVGHTASKEGIQVRCGGMVIMIDVGLSRYYYNGRPECLLIEKGRFFVVTPEGKKPLDVPVGSGKAAKEEARPKASP